MTDWRDGLPAWEYHRRAQAVYWGHEPACGSKGPHGATCLREPGHGGALCQGQGVPDAYGPKGYSWDNDRVIWL